MHVIREGVHATRDLPEHLQNIRARLKDVTLRGVHFRVSVPPAAQKGSYSGSHILDIS
jgi:sirohydrochlorin ferrochelatase